MNKLAKFVRTPMFEGKYDANEDDAVKTYHLLNKYVFDNVLDRPKFNIKRTRGYWGMCDGRMDILDERFFVEEITLSKKFTHKAMFVATIAHEMVHLYQMTWVKDPYANHNANFFAWKNKFKLAGLGLSRC